MGSSVSRSFFEPFLSRLLDSSAGIDRSFITSGCARCRDSMLSLGRLRQSQYGVGTQACVVGVELGGVSQAEAVAAIASASAGSLTDQRGLQVAWLCRLPVCPKAGVANGLACATGGLAVPSSRQAW